MDPIVLIGFMGSGKTTLGRALATALGVDFVDLDLELERIHGCSVAYLIERDGEPAFRTRELEVLEQLVAGGRRDCVVATGGGIVETEAARALLPRLGRVVWLRADPEACVARLGPARATRPLLARSDWRARYALRAPWYAAAAAFVVDTHPDPVASSVRVLLRWLGREAPDG